MRMTVEERFESKIHYCPTTGCWLWGGSMNRGGYGQFWDGQRHPMAHRYSYEKVHGPIKDGLVLDHICCNRACVNPNHLRACTPRENVLAPWSQSVVAVNHRKTRCPRCASVYVFTPAGRRRCRECGMRDEAERYLKNSVARRAKGDEYYAKNKAEILRKQRERKAALKESE